jgi:hypothetical protein
VPPFVPLTDGAQVEIKFLLGPLLVENRLFFVSRQPPIDFTQLTALASGIGTWHTTQVLPYLSSAIELDYIAVTDWTGSAPGIVALNIIHLSGGDNSGCHSANVSIRVRFKGDSSLPHTYNSNFISGIPYSGVDTNAIGSTLKTQLRNAYINLIDLAAGFGPFPAWRWVVTSFIEAGNYRVTAAAARTDFITIPSPYISPRRRRISRLRRL